MVATPEQTQLDRLRRYGITAGLRATNVLPTLFKALDLSDLDLMTIRDIVRYGPDPEDDCLIAMSGLLLSALGEGSLCLPLNDDYLKACMRYTVDPALIGLISGFIRRLDKGRYDPLIDRTGGGAFKPMVLDDTHDGRRLYFQKFYYHERRLKQRLRSFLSLSGGRKLSDQTIVKVIDALYREEAVIRRGAGGDRSSGIPIRLKPSGRR
jgi:exodeoxyribonuclease V alpha subunit